MPKRAEQISANNFLIRFSCIMYIVVPHMAVAEVSIIGNYRRGETFALEMCFAPQRRALFLHRNFQKVLRT